MKFISFEVKACRIRPSITPEDVDKTFNALRQYFIEVDRKSVQFESNRDNETELAQREADEMMKQQEEKGEQNDGKEVDVEASRQHLKEKKVENVGENIEIQDLD